MSREKEVLQLKSNGQENLIRKVTFEQTPEGVEELN